MSDKQKDEVRLAFEKWCKREHYFVDQDGVQAAWNASRKAFAEELVKELELIEDKYGDQVYQSAIQTCNSIIRKRGESV